MEENKTEAGLPASLSISLTSAANLLQKVDAGAVSEARKKAGDILVGFMGDDGAIALDADLAIRAYQVLANSEVQILEAKRKLVETYVNLSEKANVFLNQGKQSNPLDVPVAAAADPMEAANQSTFKDMM